jgi:signal transduction histidine kinase
MEQTDGWQTEWQRPQTPARATSLGIETASEPGRARWQEKLAAKARIEEARQRMQRTGPNRQSPAIAQSLAGLIHDARNMVSAMDLYCELLEEPGVLSAPFLHYAGDLRLVSGAGRRLLDTLAAAGSAIAPIGGTQHPPENDLRYLQPLAPTGLIRDGRRKVFQCDNPVANLAEELSANQNLLSALVGHGITLGLSISGGRRPIAISGDDLTRVLVNLARNAAEAMPLGGHLQIALEECPEYLSLSFTDSGPGIPQSALETIFSPGYSTRVGVRPTPDSEPDAATCAWPVQHRGLGLSIVRSIVAAAGGSVWATNRKADSVIAASNRIGANSREAPEAILEESTLEESSLERSGGTLGAVLVVEFPLLEPPIAT